MEENNWAAVSHRQKNAFRHIRRIKAGKTRPLMEVNKHQYVLVMQTNDELAAQLKQKQELIDEGEKVAVHRDELLDKLRELERVRELLRHELNQVKDKSIKHQQEIGQLQGHVRARDARIHELESSKERVEKQVEWKLRRRYETAERDWDLDKQNYEEKITNLEMEIETLKEDKRVLRDRVVANENELIQLKETEQRLSYKMRTLNQEHSAVMGAKQRAHDKMLDVEKAEKAMNNRLEKIQRKVDQLKEERTKLKAKLKFKSKQLKECESYREQYSTVKTNTDEKIQDLKSQIEVFQDTLKEKNDTIKGLEQEKTQITKELFTSKEELLRVQTEFHQKLYEVQRAHEQTKEELLQTRSEVQTANAENGKRLTQITELNSEIEQLKDAQLNERQRILELQAAVSAKTKDPSSSESDSGSSGEKKKQRKKRKKKAKKSSKESSDEKGDLKADDVSSNQVADDVSSANHVAADHDREKDDADTSAIPTVTVTKDSENDDTKAESDSAQQSVPENDTNQHANVEEQDGDESDSCLMTELAEEFGNSPNIVVDSDPEDIGADTKNSDNEERLTKEEVDAMIQELTTKHIDEIETLKAQIDVKQAEVDQLQAKVHTLEDQINEYTLKEQNDKESKEKIQNLRDQLRRSEAKVLQKDLTLHELKATVEKLEKAQQKTGLFS